MNRDLRLLFFVFLIGCSASSDRPGLTLHGGKSFAVGHRVSHKHAGMFISQNIEYFYFGDVTTNKKISVFSNQGVKLYDIPLQSVLKRAKIDDFSVISADTVIVLSEHTNHLYFINRFGLIWKEVDLNPYLAVQDPLHKYMLLSSMYQDFYMNGQIYLRSYLIWDEPGQPSMVNQYISYFSKVNGGPFFVKISNLYGDSLKVVFGLYGFFNRFTGKNQVVDDFPFIITPIQGSSVFPPSTTPFTKSTPVH